MHAKHRKCKTPITNHKKNQQLHEKNQINKVTHGQGPSQSAPAVHKSYRQRPTKRETCRNDYVKPDLSQTNQNHGAQTHEHRHACRAPSRNRLSKSRFFVPKISERACLMFPTRERHQENARKGRRASPRSYQNGRTQINLETKARIPTEARVTGPNCCQGTYRSN